MLTKTNKRYYWREIFELVIASYQEFKSTSGTLGAFDYSKTLEGRGAGHIVGVAVPTISDYICEVELSAKRSLNDAEFAVFKVVYMEMGEAPLLKDDEVGAVLIRIQEKVGRMMVKRKLYPISRYMKSKDCRK